MTAPGIMLLVAARTGPVATGGLLYAVMGAGSAAAALAVVGPLARRSAQRQRAAIPDVG